MSISDNYEPTKDLANGTTLIYTADWDPLNTDYVEIYSEDYTTGVQTEVTTGFTAEILSTGSLKVTFDVAPGDATPADSVYIILSRATPNSQEVPFTTSSGFQAKVAEGVWDKAVAMLQEVVEGFARALSYPIGTSSAISKEIPAPVAGKAIKGNSSGDGWVNTTLDPDEAAAAAAAAALSATAAETAEINAETAETNAETAETNAETAETNAETAQAAAELVVEGLHYSVTTYGAKGDGVTNDTTAVQDTIDAAVADNRKVYFPEGTYLVTGLTIAASTDGLIMEGENRITYIRGVVGDETLLTFGDTVSKFTIRDITFYDAAIGILVPDEVLCNTWLLENVGFITITDKAFSVADNSSGADGGLIKCNFINVLFYNVKYGFHSLHNAMVNNIHFIGCSWENPIDGGYQVYFGGVDGTTVCANISIENSLFNGIVTSTSIPVFIGGRMADIFLKNVHFADWGLTGGTNDGLELITLEGGDSDVDPEIVSIEGVNAFSSRGSIINDLASYGAKVLMIKNSHLICSRAGDAVILNADDIRNFISIGNKYNADTSFSSPQNAIYIGDNALVGSVPKRLNGALIADVISVGKLISTPDEITVTNAGVAASLLTVNTEITTNDDNDLDNVTLADGVSGQIKHIYCVASFAGDTWKITPDTLLGGTQITFGDNSVGTGCTLIYADGEGWIVVGTNGGTIT